MKLTKLSFKNFRSFGHNEWNEINLDKNINLFIGKNNSGKSNILALLRALKTFELYKDETDEKQESHLEITDFFQLSIENILEFSFTVQIEKNDIEIYKEMTWLNYRPEGADTIYFEFKTKGNKGILTKSFIDDIEINTEEDQRRINAIFYPLTKKLLRIHEHKDVIKDALITSLPQDLNFLKALLKKIIILPQFRQITKGGGEYNVNGKSLIGKLNQMKNADYTHPDDLKKFKEIEKYIGELLNQENIEIKIPHNVDSIEIKIDNFTLPLDKLGTGTHELIIMVCAILLNKDDHIIGIEEPEIHIHPGLQKKLLKILSELNTIFLITTHSSALIDFAGDVNIHHIIHNGRESKMIPSTFPADIKLILDDLGYKSSDLLHSNCIIWVEGPSDKIILRKWLKLKDNKLIEGIHFSIMMYGGKLLSHLCYDDQYKVRNQQENDLINLFSINHNCAIILDSDKKNRNSKLRATGERIKNELKEKGYCWITKGREVENYIPVEIWDKYFKDIISKKINISFNDYDNINEVLEKACQKNKINISGNKKYNTNKVKHMKELVKRIKFKSMNILDLDKKMNDLISFIYQCNN
jgi:predicted ATP-dependent endonuclease of OLD family